ncbi:MAG TPA: hemolysin III family protein [Lacipirellulaceae bacterium]|nr:hemolysin III family protein [Lacipirellulaceae bacterium]
MDQWTTSQVELAAIPQSSVASDEEFVNAVTHGIGLVFAIVGALVMMAGVSSHSNTSLSIGCMSYLFTLVSVYAMSTLSHSATSPRWRTLFRQLDQAFIFLLIVGTYTPFSVAHLHGVFWWGLLALMWCVALGGFASKALFAHRVESSSVVPYLILGWISVIALPAIWGVVPPGEFALIVAGGACYTIGTFFLVNDERVRHFHAAWHLWVIAGSACHFLGLLVFVVQAGV